MNVRHLSPLCAVLVQRIHSENDALKKKRKEKTLKGIWGSFADSSRFGQAQLSFTKKLKSAGWSETV